MRQHSDFSLPPDLPRPINDGAVDHLRGMAIPQICLPSTFGGLVDLSQLSAPRTAVYFFPVTRVPGQPLPKGLDAIPGVHDGTTQVCGFQERYGELLDLETKVFGLSTQTIEYQLGMASRLNLPFEILSDTELKFCDALRVPTFEVNGTRLVKQLTLVICGGRIEHVFDPIFPPNERAYQVLQWLQDVRGQKL